jgi:hypothetical protein
MIVDVVRQDVGNIQLKVVNDVEVIDYIYFFMLILYYLFTLLLYF